MKNVAGTCRLAQDPDQPRRRTGHRAVVEGQRHGARAGTCPPGGGRARPGCRGTGQPAPRGRRARRLRSGPGRR
ncbi:hypothetical protein [Nocardioides convexus]|uniref:hypothetical protein n=1 Tax=Nocardioides convexus TaxID=2712224 RepID=UPI0024187DE4|nr:hypothetical protein [Nocardioides convexus]